MKLTITKVQDKFLLVLDKWNTCTVEIDGKMFLEFTKGWIDHRPKSVVVIEKHSRIVGYGNLTPVDYTATINALVADAKQIDDGYYFDDLDKEYAYKQFLREHEPIREDYEERVVPEIVEIDITGITDIPEIVPFRYLGTTEYKNGESLYVYIPQPYVMAQMVAKELGIEEVLDAGAFNDAHTKGKKWSIPDHGKAQLEFLRINGSYATANRESKFYGINPGTWDECKKRYNEHKIRIRDIFRKALKKIEAEGEPYDKAYVISKLEQLERIITNVVPTKKTYGERNAALKLIQDTIKEL
jgi:hypothetical protein